MSPSQQGQPYWNLFALELQKVLAEHGRDLSDLHAQMGMDQEKVLRLQASLHEPPRLPVLDPEELEMVKQAMRLDPADMSRLRAALLVTAIQMMLSDRIGLSDSQQAAQQILPLITESLLEHRERQGLDNERGDIDPLKDEQLRRLLDAALDAMDRGASALTLSSSARPYAERVKQAKQAYKYYSEAIVKFEGVNQAIQKRAGWITYRNEVQKGLEQAIKRLNELGE